MPQNLPQVALNIIVIVKLNSIKAAEDISQRQRGHVLPSKGLDTTSSWMALRLWP